MKREIFIKHISFTFQLGMFFFSPISTLAIEDEDFIFNRAYCVARQIRAQQQPIVQSTQDSATVPSLEQEEVRDAMSFSHTQSTLINLNIADVALLKNIMSIGPIHAEAIIEYREQLPNKRFESIDQLLKVKGMTQKRLDRIRANAFIG